MTSAASDAAGTARASPLMRPKWRVRLGAAILSLLFPGAGHIYVGSARRGAALAAAALLWNLLYYGSPYGAALWPQLVTPALVLATVALGVVLTLGAASDAFRLAGRERHVRLPVRRRWLAYAIIVAVPSLPGLLAPVGWAQYTIPSASMVPTLRVGDHVLAIDGYYSRSAPKRGDLVAFHAHGILLIKRLVGLPGDRIEMRDGILFIDGVQAPLEPMPPLAEREPECSPGAYPRYRETLPGGSRHPIILGCGPAPYRDTAPVVVPAGHYFMMGDNRDDSDDSRDPVSAGGIGFVSGDAFVSRAIFVAFSLDGAQRWLGLPFALRGARTALPLE